MFKIKFNSLVCFIGLLLIGFSFSGCLTYKQIVNFQDGDDLEEGKVDSIKNLVQVIIKPDDILSINISSYNMEEANRFNIVSMQVLTQASNYSGSGVKDPIGYRVDANGRIDMPVLGSVYVKDLTVEKVRDLVHQKVGETGYLKNYSVEVRYLTFKVTILGEVNNPGTYTINNTKLNVLEALGLANDVTIYSNRDNILVIREKDGERQYARLDMKTKKIFESPYYYLQPNDVLYVEPHKSRILATPDPVTRYATTLIAVATLVTLIVSLF